MPNRWGAICALDRKYYSRIPSGRQIRIRRRENLTAYLQHLITIVVSNVDLKIMHTV